MRPASVALDTHGLAGSSTPMPMAPALEFVGVTKRFGAVEALRDVSLAADAGRVHALLGENGAGKSTLLKVLSGAHPPTAGCLRLGGAERRFRSPADAIAAGVAVIYQELHLAPDLTVAENVYLGQLPARCGWVDRRRLLSRSREQLARLRADIDPAARVASLSIAQRQMVEIAKALARGARVIAFDEPTSSLSARESQTLFNVIRELRAAGAAILYVSHRLEEVFQLCDHASVLRDGRLVAHFPSLAGVGQADFVRAMVGREISDVYAYTPRPVGPPRLELQNLIGPGLREPVNLAVAAGEIVGLFGLVGAGRTELLRLIVGLARRAAGAVRVDARPIFVHSPRDALAAGLALCPEDRKREGVIPQFSVLENLNLSARRLSARAGWLNRRWEARFAADQMRRLSVRARSPLQPLGQLSGGNQQKVVLGRGLVGDVRALLLDEPTRGVDVGARSEIYAILHRLAASGVAILLASSELPEILGLCDRVVVMREGRVAGCLPRAAATQETLMRLALPGGD